MAGDTHGTEEAQVTQAPKDGNQQAQENVQVDGMDWESAIRERDSRIDELEAQVAEAAKTAEAAEALRGEIAKLKAQGEDQRRVRAEARGRAQREGGEGHTLGP